ncbi:putative T7SS-secreted protein [Nocardia camponoti]|uniref:Type IV secretion protein Rhs n=1 Tax=Nocardia camponoti TaxID=1616106 RepID=A0A917Q974_9NOCA|nr:RHS repeat-associated core domain-containing protein [Nocardia camponoti]GGK37130.1 hypothetical protein GCM10011591_06010 [Nocardia camponoti]
MSWLDGIGNAVNSIGDKIEDGLETAAEKVGGVYNTVLDAEAAVAKALGADGLADTLDSLGDRIAAALGAAVPEKELGETSDPKELIQGDPAKINEVKGHVETIGTAINTTGDALRKIDVADWTGDTATAFDQEYSKQPKLWWDGADAMGKAKTALDAWYHEVVAAQAKASEAIAKWEAADREERDRKNEWNAKSDEEKKGRNLTDTWTDMRNAARAILTAARTQRDNAANSFVTAINAATSTAPTEPPFLSRWGSNFDDLDAAMEQAKLNFTSGLLTSLTGIVQFVRSVNPTDIYNMTHPAEYIKSMSDLGTGMVVAAADPKATVSALVSGFRTNPSEALGALTGDLVTTLATGGAGGAAKVGLTAVDKVTDAAKVTNAARNVVQDGASVAGKNVAHAPNLTTAAPKVDAPAAHPTGTHPEAPSSTRPDAAAKPADSPGTSPADNDPAASGTHPDAKPEGASPDAPGSNPAGAHPDSPSTAADGAPNSPAPAQTDGATPHESPTPDRPAAPADNTPAHTDGPDNARPNDPDSPVAHPDSDAPARPHDGDAPAAHPDGGEHTPDNTAHDPDRAPATDPGNAHPDATHPTDNLTGTHDTPDPKPNPEANNNLNTANEHDNNGSGGNNVHDTGKQDAPEHNSTDEQTCKGRDPVNMATGEFLLPQTDVDLPGILRLVLRRGHYSNYRFGRWFGPSWSATLDMRVVVGPENATVVFEDGMLLPYPHSEVGVGVEPVTGGQRWKLTRTETGGYRLWDPDRELVWHFAPERVLDGLDTQLGNFAISAITDRHHNRIRFHYDALGAPTAITHSGGYRLELTTHAGRVTAISVAGEETVTRIREFAYTDGALTTVTNGVGGQTRFAYDAHHRMVSWTDSNNSSVVNTYDEHGRVVVQRGTDGVFNGELDYTEFGAGTGRLTRSVNSQGAVTSYGFDSDLRLRDLLTPDGGHRHIDYNALRKPLAVTEPDGAVTRYAYTADGDVAVITRPDGSQISIDYAYANRPSRITNPDGTVLEREWSKSGDLAATVDALGGRTTFAYADNGAVQQISDPDGNRTHVEVNAAGLPIAITDAYGATTRIVRDHCGRPIHVTDPIGSTTRYEWNAEGRLAARVDAQGHRETWTYDGENNLLRHVNAIGAATTYTYGGFDKVAARTDPDGSTTRYLYDTELRLTAVINPLGHRWSYEYDPTGRLIAETDYTGATTTYTHTASGRIATVTPATGVTRSHRYDILGNLTSITADTGEYLSYTHDAAGRVLTALNGVDETPTHALEFTYTATGAVATQKLDDQPAMVNDYDHRGRRTSRTTPTGSTTTWSYNSLGQVTAMTADDQPITFTHDRAGRLAGWRIGEVEIDRTFTPTGQLATQQVTGFPAATLSLNLGFGDAPARPDPFTIRRDEYAYRPDGFLTHHRSTSQGAAPTLAEYALDALGRVTSITRDAQLSEAYEYDGLSNITASLPFDPAPETPSVPPQLEGREYHNNLLVRDGRNHYYYDPAGRLIRKVTTRISRKPAVWHYRYNAFDQLTDVYTPEGEWWQYTYDALGDRTSKCLLDPTGNRTSELVRFVFDDNTLVEEIGPHCCARWSYLPGTRIALTQSASSTLAAIVVDQSGLALQLVHPSAEAKGTGRYKLWGDAVWRGISTPLRFAGQYADDETGLHHNGFRVYDPAVGRYTTSDPCGISPSPNPYGYPRNPTHWADPLGLAPDACSPGSRVPEVVDPSTVRFTQDSISQNFRNGDSVFSLADALRSGRVLPGEVPAIRVFERDGNVFSLDNRRLAAFQMAGVEVPVVPATAAEVARDAFKMTSKTDGQNIRIRGEGGLIWPN